MKIEFKMHAAIVEFFNCDKSTIILLLKHFYDSTFDCITLNENDISLMFLYVYHCYMFLMQQESSLYFNFVCKNIAINLKYKFSEEKVHEAYHQINILNFVFSLLKDLNTSCDLKNLQFFNEQRQRIAVAKVLIQKSHFLLLDEATSALNIQSECIVQKALNEATLS